MTRMKFYSILKTLILFPLVFVNVKPNAELNKIIIDVYYSPEDTKSALFFEQQLVPLMDSSWVNHIDITLNPFAGCEMKNKEIVCKSKKDQMYGNVHLACAFYHLYNVKSRSEGEPFNVNAVMYIACTVAKITSFERTSRNKCVDYLHSVMKNVYLCMRGSNDTVIMEYYEKAQKLNMNEYPVITLNGEISSRARDSIIDEICKKYPEVNPELCGDAMQLYTVYNFFYVIVSAISSFLLL